MDRLNVRDSTATALTLSGLSYTYPSGHSALHDVDLQIHRGERVALLGPNGAGKTTLILHLAGVLAGTGHLEVAGLPAHGRNLREIRRRVGVVFQDPDDQLFMPTVREDVAFGPANFGVREPELADRVRGALESVGMAEYAERPPTQLSYGQRRRVALATVLACAPEVLVLDEPSANLEPVARRELAELLDDWAHTTLLVTHDLPYALRLCSRGVLLSGGRVVADRPIRELLGDEQLLAAHRLELPWGFSLD